MQRAAPDIGMRGGCHLVVLVLEKKAEAVLREDGYFHGKPMQRWDR
jgi:hypothetical protein